MTRWTPSGVSPQRYCKETRPNPRVPVQTFHYPLRKRAYPIENGKMADHLVHCCNSKHKGHGGYGNHACKHNARIECLLVDHQLLIMIEGICYRGKASLQHEETHDVANDPEEAEVALIVRLLFVISGRVIFTSMVWNRQLEPCTKYCSKNMLKPCFQ